mmetsp:Transcript_31275/g.69027  ORF Transcript_31275/g.69027 Transcript_31275/m.69027 type:complete len:493 (-) Transcript_31275:109-1587(-)
MNFWGSPLTKLTHKFANLIWTADSTVDMANGREACEMLLKELSATTQSVEVRLQSRAYRAQFAVNYKRLFDSDAHNYNLDVLKAAVEEVEQGMHMYVNGQMYAFAEATSRAAGNLSLQWGRLIEVLGRIPSRSGLGMGSHSRMEVVREQLEHFDAAWADFENLYILELMRIEEDARSPIRSAMDEEATLHVLEENAAGLALLATDTEYHEACLGLISQLARINAVVHKEHSGGTGRDDLGMEVLLAVSTQLDDYGQPKKRAHRQFAEAVAWRAYQSWLQVREYLTTMATMVEHVDPQVSNNTQLVKALAAWENDWASAKKYLLDAEFCDGICVLLEDLKDVIAALPPLQRLVSDRAPELLLSMPQLVLLHFLFEPSLRAAVVKRLLPELVGSSEDCALLRKELAALERALTSCRPEATCKVQKLLMVVMAAESLQEKLEEPMRSSVGASNTAAHKLLRMLQPWSFRLQRTSPDDWNAFCQALVDHLESHCVE